VTTAGGTEASVGELIFAAVQIVGAVLVLACFLLAQVDRADPGGYRYLVGNLAGSEAMAVTAIIAGEWGFVLLEGVWALVSAWGLVQRLRGLAARAVH
jgi:hypothetical protein